MDHLSAALAAFLGRYGLFAGSAVYCFLGGLTPIFNIEAYLLFVGATAEGARHWLPVAAAGAAGHTAAKLLLYAAGRGIGVRVPLRHRERLEGVRQKLERWQHGRAAFIFLSASVGFPPLYLVSVVAGTLRVNWVQFAAAVLVGRFARFAVLLLSPHAALRLLPGT